MNLLITTQVVDRTDPRLGFFHRWIEEFAKHCEHVTVICLFEGAHSLPPNVTIYSLGKEKSSGHVSKLQYAVRFLKLIFSLRNSYDEVFVHMNPEYVVLGGIWWRLWHKRIGLWYLHKSVDLKLRLATLLTNVVFTASKESFRLASTKVQYVGHGIDVLQFAYAEKQTSAPTELRLITVGRLSPSKKVHVLIGAVRVFAKSHSSINLFLTVVGDASSGEDQNYAKELSMQGRVLPSNATLALVGAKTNDDVAKMLGEYDLFIHASTGTGSVDKAVLEPLLCGVPVITTSEAFKDLLTPYGLYVPEGTSDEETEERMAKAIETYLQRTDREEVRRAIRATVAEKFSLVDLIPRILSILGTLPSN